MANYTTTFVSPGVYTREVDLSFVTTSIGITTLGLAGETLKGPAFEPIAISSKNDFLTRFGGQSTEKFSNGIPKYELPYIANAYLEQSNQLYVTRILGLSGYDAGNAWAIKTSAGLDPSTTGVVVTTGTTSFTGNTFSNATIQNLVSDFDILPITPLNSGSTFNVASGSTLVKVGSNFTASQITMIVNTLSANTQGTASFTLSAITGTSYTAYENITVALIRPRANYVNNTLISTITAITIDSGATTNPLSPFNLTTETSGYTVSFDTTSQNYITKVLGVSSKDKNVQIYVDEVYPNMLINLINKGYVYGITPTLAKQTALNNYKSQFQTPETPFIVSELRGNQIERLFQFVMISDGDDANKEIKISIENINLDTREFDVVVRDYNDSDSNPILLEAFRKLTLNPKLISYIGKRIGTDNEDFDIKSNYIMVHMDDNAPMDAVPAGFEGYKLKNYSGVNAPVIQYKTSYNFANEKVKKTYLGISDIVGIDQSFFNYLGQNISTGTTKGFHLDSGATGNYDTGIFSFQSEGGVVGTDYEALAARKFVVAPAGGFDGWDIFRTNRTNTDIYRIGQPQFSAFTQSLPSDYYAYLQGIQTFKNPSDIAINLFATPGIDYSNQNSLVNETIEMIEETRADSLYIVTTPDAGSDDTAAQDMVDLLDAAGIDSNYTCTYAPWVQLVDDQNNTNIYLPPTYEVLRNMAMTDNKYAPWFAVGGYNRGKLVATKARLKVNQDTSDTLYDGRINPLRKFPDSPLLIMGNKNLQVADSALNRVNVRRLLLQVRKLVSAVAVRLVFEPNDDVLQTQFKTLVNPILQTVKEQRGLEDFKVICDNTVNTAATKDQLQLIGKIYLKPTLAAEYIILDFNVTDQGANFANI